MLKAPTDDSSLGRFVASANAVSSIAPGPVAPPPRHHAAAVGVAASSDAAARSEEVAVAATGAKKRRSKRSSREAHESHAPLELVWFEPTALELLRRTFKDAVADAAFEEAAPGDEEARRDLLSVLTREPAMEPTESARVVGDALDKRSRFAPPIRVVVGELRARFSPVARLRASVEVGGVLSTGDNRWRELLASAQQLLELPRPDIGGAATQRATALRDAYAAQAGKGVTRTLFDEEVARVLLEQRAFDERTLFGDKHLVFDFGDGTGSVPAYAPLSVRDWLPLFDVLQVRVIAELHPRQDRAEGSPIAARLLALGRSLDRSAFERNQ